MIKTHLKNPSQVLGKRDEFDTQRVVLDLVLAVAPPGTSGYWGCVGGTDEYFLVIQCRVSKCILLH